MFYGIGGISTGIQRRQKEQRAERAAIREEFERWKANNPYATAMDFHAKVKQLGAQTPGGTTVMPDSASIQRMAAENLRRKQEEEAEKERRRRIQDMDMKIKETTYARQLLMDNPNMSASQLLNSMGMPTTGATLEWAEGLQQKMKTELEQAQADRARKLEQEDFRRRQELAGLELKFYEANPAATEADRNAFMAQFGGATPAATSVAAPAALDPTYGPTGSSKPPAPAKPASSARLQTFIDGQFSGKQGQYLGPDGFEQLKKDVIRTARMGGARSASDAEIIAALEASDFFAEYSKSADDLAFASQLGGKQPSELSITVGDGKNAMAIELAEIYKSQLNNSNILSSRRIPYDKLDEFQSIVAPYFEVVDGKAQMKTIQDVPMEQVLAQVEQQLNTAGIYNQDQLAMQRQRKIAEYGQVDSLDILLADQKAQLDEVVKERAALMKSAGSAAEQNAVLADVAQRFKYFKGLIENDRIADIYANDGIYPLDILPTNQHALYQKDAFYALFDDAMAELNQIAAANKAQVQTDGEANEAAETARLQDVALQVMQSDFGDEQVEAVLELVVPTERRMASIETDAEGNIQYDRRGQLPDSLLVNELTSSDKTRRTGVAKAVATAVEVFNSFRDMPVSEVGMANKQGFGGIAMGAAQSTLSNFSQALAPFPQYNAALKSATDQFKATVQLIPGLSSDDIEELGTEFNAWLLQSTRHFFNAGSTGPYAKLNQPGRFEGFRLPSGQVDAAQRQMLQKSVPGAQFVVPN